MGSVTSTTTTRLFSFPKENYTLFKYALCFSFFSVLFGFSLYRYNMRSNGSSLIKKLRGDLTNKDLENKCKKIKKKVYKMWEKNPAIVHLHTSNFLISQSSINFICQTLIAQSSPKDSEGKLLIKPSGFRKSDVFLEPFEEGICIDDNLTQTHRLIFNKFPVRDHHVLVITKEKEKQSDLLNARDFEASLIAMKSLDGILFYNSGPLAGASQSHKHI